MPIEKLQEFARDGQKNTDDLTLTDGFPVLLKPARQWFNWLFHSITSKINELIELDPISKTEIVDNLTTNDATKPLSAKRGKDLQDNKLDKSDLKDASTSQKGIVKLNNTLISDAEDEAATAGTVKLLNDRFTNDFLNTKTETGYQKYPSGRLEQWARITANGSKKFTFPVAFGTCITDISVVYLSAVNDTGNIMNLHVDKNSISLTSLTVFAGARASEQEVIIKVSGY